MKRLSLGVVAACLLTGAIPAFAAQPVPFDPWTGLYAGGNFGISLGRANDSATYGAAAIPFGSTSSNLDGIVGGAQVGYNWRINSSWVWGLETDLQGTTEGGTGTGIAKVLGCPPATFANCPVPVTTTATLADAENLPWFGTVRGRVGFLTSWGPLVYATGGLAYGGINSNPSLTIAATTLTYTFNTTRAGWTVGGGVEGWLDHDWTWKVEYLYLDFGTFSNTFTGIAPFTPITLTTHVTDNIVRAGMSYHFH